jgi:hypothetical protein
MEVSKMTERNQDTLIAQTQRWWDQQHANCNQRDLDPLGRPFEAMSWLYTQEDLGQPLCPMSCRWEQDRTREQLVATLYTELTVGAVHAAGLLQQPDVGVALEIASALVPAPYDAELTFVTDLIKAAGAQTVQDRNRSLVGAGVSMAALASFIFWGRGRS